MEQAAETQPKKGLPTLAWIGIGCGVLVVIVAIALTVSGLFVAKKIKDVAGDLDFEGNPAMVAARVIVRMNPELEEVSVDEEAGTITVRHTETGETVTLSIEDLQEGRISFETDEGEVTIEASGEPEEGTLKVKSGDDTWTLRTGMETTGDVPDWVPVYPELTPENPHSVTTDEGLNGGFQLETGDGVDQVVAFYRHQLSGADFETRVNEFSGGDGESGAVVYGEKESAGRSVTIMVRQDEEGATRIAVSYQQRNEPQ
jgi:hypothetical protein